MQQNVTHIESEVTSKREMSRLSDHVQFLGIFFFVPPKSQKMVVFPDKKPVELRQMHHLLHNASWGELIQTAQMVKMGTGNVGTFLLDFVLIVVVVVLLLACGAWACFKGRVDQLSLGIQSGNWTKK